MRYYLDQFTVGGKMASVEVEAGCCSSSSPSFVRNSSTSSMPDPISQRYRSVDERETPLPRHWNANDKSALLGLSENCLTVHYKGQGKTHRDAASIRTTYPIPTSCGIYYFEVKVISKGRDGYMGIGLSTSNVSLSRLPGWDKNSFGYHGDDGNMFCSSGTGQPYSQTFTTGDVIGCCLNLIEGTCFYTKNGSNLGIAFRDLPTNLHPTVGLQTPGEVVEANFGQDSFVFQIDDYIQEWRQKTTTDIDKFPLSNKTGEWQQALQKIVSSYLVHHGYCATAESFLRSTGQSCDEELASIQNRQKIQSLVLAGRIGEAISQTQQLYPGLLERKTDLLFTLQCRQFVEIVNGTEGESVPTELTPLVRRVRRTLRPRPSDSRSSPAHGVCGLSSQSSSPRCEGSTRMISPPPSSTNGDHSTNGTSVSPAAVVEKNSTNSVNGDQHNSGGGVPSSLSGSEIDTDMDTLEHDDKTVTNGNAGFGGPNCVNGSAGHSRYSDDSSSSEDEQDYPVADMETDIRMSSSSASGRLDEPMSTTHVSHPLCGGSEAAVERLLQFGRQLHQLSEQLQAERGALSDAHRKALRDAFSLLAYSDPWNSPVGYQLNPMQREPVCKALNSAILELQGLPKQPPLELAIAHVSQCVRQLSKAGIGSCAFANPLDYLQ